MNTVPQRNREHWHYDRITTPRAAWHDGADGQRRLAARRLRALLIGSECKVGDCRVIRDAATTYEVYHRYELKASCYSVDDVLALVFDKVLPLVFRAAVPIPPRRYRGVYWRKREQRWVARIGYQSREIRLGSFDTDTEAARAYDAFVLAHGLDRPLNFPQERAA